MLVSVLESLQPRRYGGRVWIQMTGGVAEPGYGPDGNPKTVRCSLADGIDAWKPGGRPPLGGRRVDTYGAVGFSYSRMIAIQVR